MLNQIVLMLIGLYGLLVVGFIFFIAKSHKKVIQGTASVRTGFGGAQVALDAGMFVIPMLHAVETLDISIKTLRLEKKGREGIHCKDNIRANLQMDFFVRVNKDPKYIIEVAQTIGCERAGKIATIKELFHSKFEEAVKTVAKRYDFEELLVQRQEFKYDILETIGTDLNGFILDDLAIHYIEQTSIKDLNPNNILDAKGILKIKKSKADLDKHLGKS